MTVFEFFKHKKQTTKKQPEYNVTQEELNNILQQEIETFFPKTGSWTSSCYKRPEDVSRAYLPCHLRDNEWLSKLMQQRLADKQIYAPLSQIEEYLTSSPRFGKLRHNYELEIVRWQIDWIAKGGSNWLMPEGYGEISLLIGTSVDRMVRGGVVKTLSAIGLDREVIEEGIEKNADLWRDKFMKVSFDHKFDPVIYGKGCPDIRPSEDHCNNWMKLRTYEYYLEHKESVDKYGIVTDDMKMTDAEASDLKGVVINQNMERSRYVEEWERSVSGLPSVYDIM